MNTKIVYVVISNKNSIYVEQAYMSIWSCKKFNPDANIYVVTDSGTKDILKSYPALDRLLSELIIKEFPSDISNFERSRILKTTLRELISGDYLFVDTDTIICGSIEEIDSIKEDICIVEDTHIPKLSEHPFKKGVSSKFERLYGISPSFNEVYYNSGVIFCKDTSMAHDFYKIWHSNWLASKDKSQGMFDQPSLLKTVIENPGMVKTLDPNYNVQILGCIRYLCTGKILHFFNANWGRDSVHPFLNKKYYHQIKHTSFLSEKVKSDIMNCKSLFAIPTFIIGPEDVPYWLSRSCQILKKLQNSPRLNSFVTTMLKVINKIFKLK